MTDRNGFIYKYCYLLTPVGGRSFTDISVCVHGIWFGSRHHGAWSLKEIKDWADATWRRLGV